MSRGGCRSCGRGRVNTAVWTEVDVAWRILVRRRRWRYCGVDGHLGGRGSGRAGGGGCGGAAFGRTGPGCGAILCRRLCMRQLHVRDGWLRRLAVGGVRGCLVCAWARFIGAILGPLMACGLLRLLGCLCGRGGERGLAWMAGGHSGFGCGLDRMRAGLPSKAAWGRKAGSISARTHSSRCARPQHRHRYDGLRRVRLGRCARARAREWARRRVRRVKSNASKIIAHGASTGSATRTSVHTASRAPDEYTRKFPGCGEACTCAWAHLRALIGASRSTARHCPRARAPSPHRPAASTSSTVRLLSRLRRGSCAPPAARVGVFEERDAGSCMTHSGPPWQHHARVVSPVPLCASATRRPARRAGAGRALPPRGENSSATRSLGPRHVAPLAP